MDLSYSSFEQDNPEQFAVFCELLREYDAEIDIGKRPQPLSDERIQKIAQYILGCAKRSDSWLELLYAQGEPVGFLFYEVDDGSYGTPETLGYGFIREIYIRPEYRRHGFGSRCFAKIEDAFRKNSVKQIWLTSDTEAGASFWRSLGFISTGKRCQRNNINVYVKPIGFTRSEIELAHFKIEFDEIQELQAKDGVFVYRIAGNKPCVLKCYEKDEHKREIKNYLLLQSLGIKTVKVIDFNENAFLMEDITQSPTYRLATRADMDDPDIMRALAKWYRELHAKGRAYVRDNTANLFCETDDITLENIRMVKEKTQTAHEPVWTILEKNFKTLRELIDRTPKTLTYNDFYYTNMIVSKAKSISDIEAFMFDYNLLGKGFACADLINVTYEISNPAKTAFLNEYGEYDHKEMQLVKITGTLFALITACKRPVFPDWAKKELAVLKGDDTFNLLKTLLA